MKQKCAVKPLLFTVSAVLLCSCSNSSEIITEKYVMGSNALECFYESESFDCVGNGSQQLITYYSADADKRVPICTKPDCTHVSYDCSAVVRNAKGIIKTDDGLMFFDYGEHGELELIKSDFNGSDRRKIASLENLTCYSFIDIAYCGDKALCVYYDMVSFEEGGNEDKPTKMADKYVNRIACIDINSGETANILYKKDHAARVLNALIYDNKLIYSYQSYTCDIRTLPQGEGLGDYYLSGIYSLDLATGEEKKLSEGYEKMIMAEQSFDNFDPEKIICHDLTDRTLYLYNMNTGKFSPVGECASTYTNFIADGSDIFYLIDKDDTQYARYSFETGKISYAPMLPANCHPSCITGKTVWLSLMDEKGRYCRGWIDKDDFLKGDHGNIRFAYYINSLDGSAGY